MNKKNIIKHIKTFFDANKVVSEDVNPADTLEFVEVKTVDGRILRADDMAPEVPVVEITPSGEVAVDDDEYELEDGNILVITGGIITDIKIKQEEIPEEVTEEMEAESEVVEVIVPEVKKDAKEVTTIESTTTTSKFSEEDEELLFNTISTILTKFEAFEATINGLEAKVEEFGSKPSVEPTKTIVDFSNERKLSHIEQFVRLNKKNK